MAKFEDNIFDSNSIRSKILEASLKFEHIVSDTLCYLLDIDKNDTVCFGMTGEAIGFEYKVRLLMDIKSINSESKEKLTKFMSVRNKFLHNLKIDSYEKCFDSMNGFEGYLKKIYKSVWKDDNSRESNLGALIDKLIFDCEQILNKLFFVVMAKIRSTIDNESNSITKTIYEKTVAYFEESKINEPFTISEFKSKLDEFKKDYVEIDTDWMINLDKQ